jgi:carbon storage regulator
MLVLTRRVGEEIVIAGHIRVSVVTVHGHRVRLGITAPPSVNVVRMELFEHHANGNGVAKPSEKPALPKTTSKERGGVA